jgi:hypothetical protein
LSARNMTSLSGMQSSSFFWGPAAARKCGSDRQRTEPTASGALACAAIGVWVLYPLSKGWLRGGASHLLASS